MHVFKLKLQVFHLRDNCFISDLLFFFRTFFIFGAPYLAYSYFVKKMGKHKFNSGRVCEHCAGYADSLPKDGNGKFHPCSEAPEEGKTNISSVHHSLFFTLFVALSCLFLHVRSKTAPFQKSYYRGR